MVSIVATVEIMIFQNKIYIVLEKKERTLVDFNIQSRCLNREKERERERYKHTGWFGLVNLRTLYNII